MHADRGRGGRPRTRILYWFRTPPGVRVGRSALDENAIREIEQSNPGLTFDWTRILKGEGSGQQESRPRGESQERRQPRPGRPREPRPSAPPSVPTPVAEAPPRIEVPEPIPPIPLETLPEPRVELPESPAAALRLGSEGLERLRARHAEVLARISEKITDPARRAELKSQADRLNPDTWVTDEDVTAGLEQYESVFEALRSVVGRRRKRRKRRGGAAAGPGGPPSAEAGSADAAGDDDGTDDEGTADDGDDL